MKEAFYKNRSKLIGKKSKDVPLITSEYGKNVHESENIYINESLTLIIRKKLLGRVNVFKRANKWRHFMDGERQDLAETDGQLKGF